VLLAASVSSLAAQAPGERLVVRDVSFTGNDAIDDYTLEISIATSKSPWLKRYWWIRWLGLGTPRYFDELEFRRDVLRLQLLYRQHGYYEAQVDTVVRRERDHVKVEFRVAEGLPIVVDTITIVRGDSAVRPRRLLDRMPLQEGRPLNRFLFEASADTILFSARERGYPFTAVFRNYSVDRQARLAQVSYQVETGPRARVGEIVIDSSPGVDPDLVRRFLSLRVGDQFSQNALFASQRTLYRTDMFRYVSVGLHPDSVVDGMDSLVRIRVTVAEGPRARVRAGVGYGTIDCFRTQATATVANFSGGGRRLDLVGRLSKLGVGAPTRMDLQNSLCSQLKQDRFSDTLDYTLSATITQQALFTRRTAGSITGFAERRSELQVYQNVRIGGALSFMFGTGNPPGATLTYRIANSRTNADRATFCTSFDRCDDAIVDVLSRGRRQASLGLALTDVHVNSPIDASSGHSLSGDLMTAARLLGSQIVFSKVVGDASWYRPLTRRWVIAARLRAGLIRPGASVVSDSAVRFVPPEERFYLGGPNTMRGYGRNAMGPVVYVATDTAQLTVGADSAVTACRGCRTSPLGSGGVVLANFEIRAPSPVWGSRLRLGLFVDAGKLWEQTDASGLVPSPLRITPGFGIRFATPLGPMRFDVGYNHYPPECGAVYLVGGGSLDRQGDGEFCPPRPARFTQRLEYHFSVGQAF
jgi:outer membrane protein assembly complex protein YaeT